VAHLEVDGVELERVRIDARPHRGPHLRLLEADEGLLVPVQEAEREARHVRRVGEQVPVVRVGEEHLLHDTVAGRMPVQGVDRALVEHVRARARRTRVRDVHAVCVEFRMRAATIWSRVLRTISDAART
jgi:predicted GNAT family acetyltransferase